MPVPSATMVVWTSAWLSGAVAADDALDALRPWGEAHGVRAAESQLAERLDLPGPDDSATSFAMLLGVLRRAGADGGELVLPVAGDVRGLGGGGTFGQAALRRGEAVTVRSAGLGIVPEDPYPGAPAEGLLHWTVHALPELPPAEHLPLGEAEQRMSATMREAASALADLDIARHRPGVREEIAEQVSSRPQPEWPDGVPARPLRVLQRAGEVQAILQTATDDSPGGALSASAMQARTQALRPLFDAVRDARCSAIAEMVRALTEDRAQRR